MILEVGKTYKMSIGTNDILIVRCLCKKSVEKNIYGFEVVCDSMKFFSLGTKLTLAPANHWVEVDFGDIGVT